MLESLSRGERKGKIPFPMLLLLRKVLFYILLLAYFILTPYILFYGLGYSVDPAEGEIYKTGLVSVMTEPKGATVFLEDKKYSGKTPAALRGLLPGQYNVRVAMKGHEPWQKTIEIIAEKATRLEPVVLLAKKPDEEKVVEGAFADILPKGSDFKIFALREKTFRDLLKIDLFFRNMTPLIEIRRTAAPVKITGDKIENESTAVLFKTEKEGKKGWVLYDLEREKMAADLTDFIPDKADLITWEPKNPDFVYVLKNGELTVMDVEESKFQSIGAGDILGIGAQRRKLYFLKKDRTLWQANARGENPILFTAKDGLEEKVFPPGKAAYYQIELLKREFFQRELFLFLGDNGELMSNWPPYRLVEKDVKGFVHSLKGDTEKILYWTDREIGVFDFALKNEEEEALPPRTLLYRSGDKIRQAFFAFENTHVVFSDNHEMFLLEAGETAPYLLRSLGAIAKDTRIFYHDRQRSLFYLHPETRTLQRRKIGA
jgi:hypothetical protein